MTTNNYDSIIIGGGHNGLVSAAYFARTGARTLVLEARNRVGGAADTSSPFADLPDVKVSTYAYVVSVMPPRIIRDLELERHGFRVFPVWGSSNPFRDGRCMEHHTPVLKPCGPMTTRIRFFLLIRGSYLGDLRTGLAAT